MDKAEGKAVSKGEKVSDAEIYNESATGVKVVTAEESMRCRILKTIGLYLAFASIVSVLSHNNCVLHSAHCNLILFHISCNYTKTFIQHQSVIQRRFQLKSVTNKTITKEMDFRSYQNKRRENVRAQNNVIISLIR